MEDILNLQFSQISRIIGENLKNARLTANITQQDMSDQINVSVSSIKKIEKGEICSFDSLMRVLKRLGKLEVLLPLIKDKKKPVMIQCYLDSKNHNSLVARGYFQSYRVTNAFWQISKQKLHLNPSL